MDSSPLSLKIINHKGHEEHKVKPLPHRCRPNLVMLSAVRAERSDARTSRSIPRMLVVTLPRQGVLTRKPALSFSLAFPQMKQIQIVPPCSSVPSVVESPFALFASFAVKPPLCSFVSFVVKPYFLTSKLTVAPAAIFCPAGGYCRTIIPAASVPPVPLSTKRTFPCVNPPLISATFASANGLPTKL